MSSPSNSEKNSVSDYESSADSDDRPLGQRSIQDSDSDPQVSQSSPERRRRKPAVDLLTALPDSLILHVLSFLPIVYAVKTEVLSKRWQYLWTYITSLVFYIRNSAGRCDRDFVAFVDKTLVLSNCSKIKKLGVQFGYAPDYDFMSKLLYIMEEKGQCSPLLKCECLRLDTGIRKSVIPGIAHMLESSPDLET